MSGPIDLTLTDAQLAIARTLIDAAVAKGDCTVYGGRLRFPDYEGAQNFHAEISCMECSTTRAYISMQAIVRKLDTAISAAARRKAVA
jgi:hypothetical protein